MENKKSSLNRGAAGLEKKILSFRRTKEDLENVSKEMEQGWCIVNLTCHGQYYVAIMEKIKSEDGVLVIPARKKLKIY